MFTGFFFKFPIHLSSIFFLLLFFFAPLWGQITFSEIMNNPFTSESNDEYIEFYNSGLDSVDLSGWFLDDSISIDAIINAGQGLVIGPSQFAILLDGSYFGNSSTYDMVIPDSALILRIADKAFGRSGLSNSTDRRLSLWSKDSILVSQFKYHSGYAPGHSNEKRILTGKNSENNWQESVRFGGTPGYRNSVSPYDLDLSFTAQGIHWQPSASVLTDQEEKFTMTVTNAGLKPFGSNTTVRLFIDANNDSVFDAEDVEIYQDIIQDNLEPQASLEINFNYTFRLAGKYRLVSELISNKDQNPLNGKSYAVIEILDGSADIKLSEIKFLTSLDEPEWVEIYNAGKDRVRLTGWGLADERDTVWIDSAVFIAPEQWKVLAAAHTIDDYYSIEDSLVIVLSHFITLNNDGDTIYLLTPAGGWQEQVSYTRQWLEGEDEHAPSLERIRYDLDARIQSNWGPCTQTDGGTPGKENSLLVAVHLPTIGNVSVSPNPFSPDGDGFEDHVLIEMQLPTPTSRLRVEIFDLSGHRVRKLKENTFSGSQDKVLWDGRDDDGHVVRMGIYIIYVQVIDDLKGVLQSLKTPLVVAGRL